MPPLFALIPYVLAVAAALAVAVLTSPPPDRRPRRPDSQDDATGTDGYAPFMDGSGHHDSSHDAADSE